MQKHPIKESFNLFIIGSLSWHFGDLRTKAHFFKRSLIPLFVMSLILNSSLLASFFSFFKDFLKHFLAFFVLIPYIFNFNKFEFVFFYLIFFSNDFNSFYSLHPLFCFFFNPFIKFIFSFLILLNRPIQRGKNEIK